MSISDSILSELNMEDGPIESHSSFPQKRKSIIVNLIRKKWKAFPNLAFQHPNLREEQVETVVGEFNDPQSYRDVTDSMLQLLL